MANKVLLILCLSFCMVMSSISVASETIGFLFNDKIEKHEPVKVYLKDAVNQSGKSQVSLATFKKALEDSFLKRRSIKFQVVGSPAESDIQVGATIKNFQYMDRGPFKPNLGVETTLLDAAATATLNYVEMAVDYLVTDTKTNKELWQGTVNEFLKKKMTEEQSMPLIYDVVTRTFIWKCFGKANLRSSSS